MCICFLSMCTVIKSNYLRYNTILSADGILTADDSSFNAMKLTLAFDLILDELLPFYSKRILLCEKRFDSQVFPFRVSSKSTLYNGNIYTLPTALNNYFAISFTIFTPFNLLNKYVYLMLFKIYVSLQFLFLLWNIFQILLKRLSTIFTIFVTKNI